MVKKHIGTQAGCAGKTMIDDLFTEPENKQAEMYAGMVDWLLKKVEKDQEEIDIINNELQEIYARRTFTVR